MLRIIILRRKIKRIIINIAEEEVEEEDVAENEVEDDDTKDNNVKGKDEDDAKNNDGEEEEDNNFEEEEAQEQEEKDRSQDPECICIVWETHVAPGIVRGQMDIIWYS